MNVEGMLPFEDMTADYIRETGNHVLYRVTPLYNGDDLVASGVQMEAQSVEDGGQGVLLMYIAIMSSREWGLITVPETAGRKQRTFLRRKSGTQRGNRRNVFISRTADFHR